MNFIRDFWATRRASAWMLVFILCFYGLLILNRGFSERGPEGIAKPAESRMTFEELKAREETFKKNILVRPQLLGMVTLVFLSVLLLGLAVNAYLLVNKFLGRASFSTAPSPPPVPWGVKDAVEVFIFLFFAEAMIVFSEIGLSLFFDVEKLNKDLLLMANSMLRDIAVAGFVLARVRRRFGQPLASIGLTLKDFFQNVRRGLLGYLAVIPWLLVLFLLISAVTQWISYEPSPQPVVEMYLKKTPGRTLLFFTFFVAIAGPVIEEIFFRGFAYTALRRRFGAGWAMAATAALFAGLHLSWVAFLPIFMLGIFLAYLYEKTGSLVGPMAAHGVHNLVMVCFTLGFKSLSG
ncbi:MAG: CPBP family intramembrane metalloprotease [Candidatus Omnitrophica bacterium]|nr:CPBP family intramembrane metalloprotease [Candidatus Omnitrophota bacterium]